MSWPPFPQTVDANIIGSRGRSPLLFFWLVFALSIPLGLIGGVTGLQLVPGVPVSSLIVTFCPLMAALILVYTENKTAGVTELLKRSFDYRRIRAKVWYVPIVLLMPGVMVLSYGLMRLLGFPLPPPQFPVLVVPVMLLAFFIGALGEELGWSGYATDPMQDRWNALQASILLGLVWAAWHIVPLVQAHRSPTWIAWYFLYTVAMRILIVWLYNNTGKSVFATVLFHGILNVSTVLFISYYDPLVTGLIVGFVAAIIIFLWGSQTLARCKFA